MKVSLAFVVLLAITLSEGAPPRGGKQDAPATPVVPETIGRTYWKSRDELLKAEDQLAIGAGLQLTPLEEKANAILMKAKNDELQAGFENPKNFLPASNFLLIKDKMKKSKVYKFIEKMPKGGILHAHSTPIVSADFLFNNFTFLPNLFLCNIPVINRQFLTFRPNSQFGTVCSLLSKLRADPKQKEKIDKLIKKNLSMETDNPNVDYATLDLAWTKFESVFFFMKHMLGYRPVYEKFLYEALREMYADNVMYAEIRTSFHSLYNDDGSELNRIQVAEVFKNVSEKFKQDHPDFLGMKMIFTVSRKSTDDQIKQYMVIANELRQRYPDFVVGFDFAGQEDKGLPLTTLVKNLNPKLPLFFHAGETNWNGLSTDLNLLDAVVLNVKRIGHAYAAIKHPKVLERVKARKIAIELNPISNQVLKLVEDLRNHAGNYLFANNYPVVVSSDDPGIWGVQGLSADFYEAFMGMMSSRADLRALKQLALNSIEYSAMNEGEKKSAYQLFNIKWNTFLNNITKSPL